MTIGTLVIENNPDHGGIWLCADDGRDVVPVARFVSEEAAKQFTELFDLARRVSHAQGQSGI